MATTKCDVCKGTGVKVVYRACATCNGYGVIHLNVPGYGPAMKLCPTCESKEGCTWKEEETCLKCEGLGWHH